MSAIFAVGALMICVITWSSTFTITDQALEIRSGIFVDVIPWRRVVKVDLLSGVTVHLDDKTERGSLQFGDSLIGALTGQPTYKPAVAALEAARIRYQARPQVGKQPEEIVSRVKLPIMEAALLLLSYVPLAMVGMYFFR
ncbi:Uncharacterised protein [Mycobacterium tuberculosis]|nr:Uncharacterised protein [Mycobacterium tuberculosis]